MNLGKELVVHLASRATDRLEGSDWEEIFARLIDAQWSPSNVGLDDIIRKQNAWGAKTIKNKNPETVGKIRLISGRNSPVFSYGDQKVINRDPDELGGKILEIWNERVAAVRAKYKHLRTVILIKGEGLLRVSVCEIETVMYMPENFWWQWNERNNLEGYSKNQNEHHFTWQPSGSQFTIIETLPKERLCVEIKDPPRVSPPDVLRNIGFENSWISVSRITE